MPKFSIRAIIVFTGLIAAYLGMMRGLVQGPTWAGFVGFAMYAGLLAFWIIYHVAKTEHALREQLKTHREPDKVDPTT
jgi:hypothetical protein